MKKLGKGKKRGIIFEERKKASAYCGAARPGNWGNVTIPAERA